MSKKNQDKKKKQEKQYGTLLSVPDGMTTRIAADDRAYLVPQYLIPAMDHAFASFRKKGDVGALKEKPQVSDSATGTDAFPASRYRRCRAPSRQLHFFIVSLPYILYHS